MNRARTRLNSSAMLAMYVKWRFVCWTRCWAWLHWRAASDPYKCRGEFAECAGEERRQHVYVAAECAFGWSSPAADPAAAAE